MKKQLTVTDYLVIDLALQDDVSFDEIKQQTGLTHNQVVSLMRQSLKPASFRRWRNRMQGKMQKHRRKMKVSAHV